MVDFTGSDWCGWCIKLKDEVFDKEAFRSEAPKRFVLVELDFPHEKELSKELKAQNEKLQQEFKIQGYPTILMLDAEGKLIGRTGYRPGGPEEYVKHLAEMVQSHEEILAMRAKLEKAKGLERARFLDRLIEAYAKLENEADETGDWCRRSSRLDAQGKAGLKPKYQCRLLMAQFAELKEAEKLDEAKAVIDKIVALQGVGGQQKQEAYFALGEVYYDQKDFPGLVSCLKKALNAARQPQSRRHPGDDRSFQGRCRGPGEHCHDQGGPGEGRRSRPGQAPGQADSNARTTVSRFVEEQNAAGGRGEVVQGDRRPRSGEQERPEEEVWISAPS